MTVSADGAAGFRWRFALHDPQSRVRVPAPAEPGVRDGLWRHTCFEVFVQGDDAPAYVEFNLSPSGQWAAYRFEDYRAGGAALPLPDPAIVWRAGDGGGRLDAVLDAASLPSGRVLRVGVSAVLEDRDGGRSHWALAHTADRPDFHRADAFVLTLER